MTPDPSRIDIRRRKAFREAQSFVRALSDTQGLAAEGLVRVPPTPMEAQRADLRGDAERRHVIDRDRSWAAAKAAESTIRRANRWDDMGTYIGSDW